jgi:hypothetical protein
MSWRLIKDVGGAVVTSNDRPNDGGQYCSDDVKYPFDAVHEEEEEEEEEGEELITIAHWDSYGDGWNGNVVVLKLSNNLSADDVVASSTQPYGVAAAKEWGYEVTFMVPTNRRLYVFFGGGRYSQEVGFKIFDSSGSGIPVYERTAPNEAVSSATTPLALLSPSSFTLTGGGVLDAFLPD